MSKYYMNEFSVYMLDKKISMLLYKLVFLESKRRGHPTLLLSLLPRKIKLLKEFLSQTFPVCY